MESRLKLSNIVAFCTFLACCVAFGTILWQGGGVAKQVQVNTARLDKLEQLVREMGAVSSAIARVETKVDGLKESLDEHKRKQ